MLRYWRLPQPPSTMNSSRRNRRSFLRRLATAGASLALGSLIRPARLLSALGIVVARNRVGNPLRIPAAFDGGELVAAEGTANIWPGESTPVVTLGGSYPGPTIHARTGERFALTLRNELSEDTIVHWHGHILPHDMDGHPMDAIGNGATYEYDFPIVNRAGTYWYHPHPHGRTAPQVYKGMAGMFIVTDDEEQALDLPRGEFDFALLVQDRVDASPHTFDYAPTTTDRLNGLFGDMILANGTPDAYHEVSADLYRIRVVNGSNARIMRLGFDSGKTFNVIGTDGGLLDRSYQVDSVFLGPAERVELLVDFSVHAVGDSLQFSTLRWGSGSTKRSPGSVLPIVRFDVSRPATRVSAVPGTLATIERLDPNAAARTRVWELNTSPIPRGGHFHWINGKTFEMERVDAGVRTGDIEIWELRNLHIMPHPIHIHGVQFQVLERIGKGPIEPRDLGWKDTIIVWGEETVRLIMRFTPYRGVYLIHCHNLEHEDGGMMLNYEIGDVVSDAEPVDEVPGRMDLR